MIKCISKMPNGEHFLPRRVTGIYTIKILSYQTALLIIVRCIRLDVSAKFHQDQSGF